MKQILSRTIFVIGLSALLSAGGIIAYDNLGKHPADQALASTNELKAGMIDPKNGKKIKYWVAPMDPTYIRYEPGKSPMGMDLVPKYEEEGSPEPTSTIRVDPVTVQNMGVRLAEVEKRPLSRTIRAFGKLTYDERRIHTVNTKFDGWIEKLYVGYTGQQVTKGQPLFDIYSPDLVTAQEEYLLALRHAEKLDQSAYDTIRDNSRRLLEATKTRLRYWGVTNDQIKRLEQRGVAEKTVTVYSPANGIVMSKSAYEGHFVKAGQHQFEIADLSRIWVDAEVYEYELPWVQEGMSATMDLAYIPGKTFEGRVLFVYPYLSEKTRTARLRLEFANPDGRLKPEMYANIHLAATIDTAGLVVPQEAIIDSGVRKVAFVAKGEGRFEPREIGVGVEADGGAFQVLSGLSEGEKVVVSAQFMFDSESRLREAIQKMLAVKDDASSAPLDDLDMSGLTMDDAAESLDMSGLTMDPADDTAAAPEKRGL